MTDEKIISVLLRCPSVREAAQDLRCTPQAIYNRMRDPDFRQQYSAARRDVLMESCNSLQAFVGDAVETMHSICMDTENSPQVRLNSADMLMRHMYRLTEVCDILTRIEALEQGQDGGVEG